MASILHFPATQTEQIAESICNRYFLPPPTDAPWTPEELAVLNLPSSEEIASALVAIDAPVEYREGFDARQSIEMADTIFGALNRGKVKLFVLLLFAAFAVVGLHAQDLPEAPLAMIQAVRPVAPLKEPFLANKANRVLVASEFSVRLLDAISTEQFIHNPCKCMHEAGSFAFAADHAPLQYGYSLAVAAGYTALSAELWKHHHRKLARGVLLFDISYDTAVGPVHNWQLIASKGGR